MSKSKYFDGAGTYKGSWETDKDANDEALETIFAPQMRDAGFVVPGGLIDRSAYDLSKEPGWITTLRPESIRLPDKLCLLPGWPGSIFFEVKDFPQTNNFQSTGFKLRHAQIYLAAQHNFDIPLVMMFKDRFSHEKGGGRAEPCESAYNDPATGMEQAYGGLLAELIPCYGSSYKFDRDDWNKQIMFRAQEGDTRGARRLMKTLPEIADDFKQRRVRRLEIDPMEWDTFRSLQSAAARFGIPPMKVPGKLVIYTSLPWFAGVRA